MLTVGSVTLWGCFFTYKLCVPCNKPVICDISGPDLDECGKNGKKGAEAMSLNKDGKSEHCHHKLLYKKDLYVASLLGISNHSILKDTQSCSKCTSCHVNIPSNVSPSAGL